MLIKSMCNERAQTSRTTLASVSSEVRTRSREYKTRNSLDSSLHMLLFASSSSGRGVARPCAHHSSRRCFSKFDTVPKLPLHGQSRVHPASNSRDATLGSCQQRLIRTQASQSCVLSQLHGLDYAVSRCRPEPAAPTTPLSLSTASLALLHRRGAQLGATPQPSLMPQRSCG